MLSDCASDRIFELCLISKYLPTEWCAPKPENKVHIMRENIFGVAVKK